MERLKPEKTADRSGERSFGIPFQESVLIALITVIRYRESLVDSEILSLYITGYVLALVYQRYHRFRHQWEREFLFIAHDILANPLFQKQKEFLHHTTSTYDHVLRVARISYTLARLLSLDYAGTARGALLHDFFLYDWRERSRAGIDHIGTHAQVALAHARDTFRLTRKEEDIIASHMFPRSGPGYRFPESALVSTVDKLAACWEYLVLKEGCMTGEQPGCVCTCRDTGW